MQPEHQVEQPVKNPGLRYKWLWFTLAGASGGLVLLSLIAEWVVTWLWMRQLGYEPVFWRIRLTELALFGVAFAATGLYGWFNMRLLFRQLYRSLPPASEHEGVRSVRPRLSRWALRAPAGGLILLVAVVFGFVFAAHWQTYFRFYWSQSFTQAEPVFQRDIGFYLFHLPFYECLQNSLVGLFMLGCAALLVVYVAIGPGGDWRAQLRQLPRSARWHLGVNGALLLGALAWGYDLDRFHLLNSSRGVVYGAGYTDVHVVRLALWVMVVASVVCGLGVLSTLVQRQPRGLTWTLGGYIGLHIVMLWLVPGVVQRFIVKPNELALETPYLQRNIDFTRQAYRLDQIDERSYDATTDLTLDMVMQNDQTLRNIRLWDWRPLMQTYRQLQEIRLYYQFYDVDIDRYHLNGDYRQVMLSARELAPQLPARADTWVNRHLQYTHGYGLAMSLVSQEGTEGLPQFLIQDLPPVSRHELTVTQPALYYGEHMRGYRIVNTALQELDYPKGDENAYTHYDGSGGVLLDAWWKRLLFAWNRFDISILITSYITRDSRIQLWQRVQERIAHIAPILLLDDDPYLVLSSGKLYWIQDAYTTSRTFPYSEPYKRRWNYIRNSVKIVMDAYDGSVTFYVIDADDPVLQVYRQALPVLFRDLNEMPPSLRQHLRYPMGLFSAQIDKFKTYHMTIPQVFYNNEDLWTQPREKYAGRAIPLEPYYILMRLPGEAHLQFLLMVPLTPENRDNMIAWIAARSDFPDYGQLVVYKLPKERLIYGPMQIEARIDQDPLISRRLSLWDQRGSKVIRGNLLVIPLDHSFLYVEPVYLIAEEMDIPQLRRVIVAYGKHVAMEPTLEQALRAVFGVEPRRGERIAVELPDGQPAQLRSAIRNAKQALQQGDWRAFGKAIEALEAALGTEDEN